MLKASASMQHGSSETEETRTFVASIGHHLMGISVLLRREGHIIAQQLADEVIRL
jgi:transketolase N-terminal domain/subunit